MLTYTTIQVNCYMNNIVRFSSIFQTESTLLKCQISDFGLSIFNEYFTGFMIISGLEANKMHFKTHCFITKQLKGPF